MYMKYCNQPESETVFSKLLFLLFLFFLIPVLLIIAADKLKGKRKDLKEEAV